MALPDIKNDSSYQSFELPSKTVISIRPFSFGEEKNFLIKVGNKKNRDVVQKETMNLLKNCVKDEDKKIFETLSKIDFIFLTIQMRKITRGSTIEYEHKCINKKCKAPLEVTLDLNNDIEINYPDKNEISLRDGDIKLIIRQIPLEQELKLVKKFQKQNEEDVNQIEFFYQYLLESGDKIIYEDKTYPVDNTKELSDFLNKLNSKDNNTILSEFAKMMSSIKIFKVIDCPFCKEKNEISFDGLNFFLA